MPPDFPTDAFAGTAAYYVRYRVPYPQDLLDDLTTRAGISGDGRLLDLACGPGTVALSLAASFREVWALDLEAEMIEAGNPSTARFNLVNAATAPGGGFAFPGSTPSVSAKATTNGIVWAVDNSQYCTTTSPGCGPSVLHAYDATDVTTELWNSSQVSADAAGNAVKFVVPTIANGKVYLATRGNNEGGASGSTTHSGELEVYGLKPN